MALVFTSVLRVQPNFVIGPNFVGVSNLGAMDQSRIAADPFAVRIPAHLDQAGVACELRQASPAGDNAESDGSSACNLQIVDCSAARDHDRRLKRLEFTCWRQKRRISELEGRLKKHKLSENEAISKAKRVGHCQLVAIARNRHHSSCAAAAGWCEDLSNQKSVSKWTIPRWDFFAVLRYWLRCTASFVIWRKC